VTRKQLLRNVKAIVGVGRTTNIRLSSWLPESLEYYLHIVVGHFPRDQSLGSVLDDSLELLRATGIPARDQVPFCGDTNIALLKFGHFRQYAPASHLRPNSVEAKRHNSFQSWLASLRMVLLERYQHSVAPAPWSAQGYTLYSRMPQGDQHLRHTPALLDIVATAHPESIKARHEWDLAPSDHASLFVEASMPLIARRTIRVRTWRSRDDKHFAQHLAAYKPAVFTCRERLLRWMRRSMAELEEAKTRKERQAQREPIAHILSRVRIRATHILQERLRLQGRLKRQEARLQRSAMTKARIAAGGVIAESRELHPTHALKAADGPQEAKIYIDEADNAKIGAKYFGSKWGIAHDVEDNRVLTVHAFLRMPIEDSGLCEADMLWAIDKLKDKNALDVDKITVNALAIASTDAGPEIAACLLQIVRNPD
jgi:hypothetical protein